MAVTQNPHIGRSQNSFSTAVFSKWKDKNTMRAKPLSVANPRTIPQQTQRNKFALLNTQELKQIPTYRIGFANLVTRMTEMNAFLQQNLKDATVVTTAPEVQYVPGAAKYAMGSLALTPSLDAVSTKTDCTISWDGGIHGIQGNQEVTDLLMSQIVVTRAGEIIGTFFSVGEVDRSDAELIVTYPENLTNGDIATVSANFYSTDKKRVSNTQHLLQYTAA